MHRITQKNFPRLLYTFPRVLDRPSKAEFTRSLLTVGYPSFQGAIQEVGHWRARMLECMVEGYLTEELKTTRYFKNLEASEKATVSFLFAQAMTHWFAQRYMDMEYLVHVRGTNARYTVAAAGPSPKGNGTMKKNSRPDFIGKCTRGFHVFESKGRSGGSNNTQEHKRLVDTALAQASRINRINRTNPITRVAACFRFLQGGLLGDIRDPDVKPKAFDLKFDENLAVRKYYSFFLDSELEEVRAFGRRYMGVPMGEYYYSIDKNILSGLEKNEDLPQIISTRLEDIRKRHDEQELLYGTRDGIALIPRAQVREK